jgi:hypothetical protein
MCIVLAAVPAIMAITSAVASAAAAGVTAYGMHEQGQAQAAAANANAKLAVQQGQATQDSARINEQQTYKQGDQLEGRARAAMGANGVDPNSGSALGVQQDIGSMTGRNVADEDYNARLQQWGGTANAGLLTAQASNDKTAADLSAGGTLLSGASQVAGKWAGWQSAPAADDTVNINNASSSGFSSSGGNTMTYG